MHISSANIFIMITDGKILLLISTMKLNVGFRLIFIDLTLAYFKDKGQVHFYCEYLLEW